MKTIFTDASGTGWGGTDGDKEMYGFWNEDQKKLHINYLELLTVKIVLFELAKDCYNCQILLKIDNTTAIAYINKMGGVRHLKFHYLAKDIWRWAEKRKIHLVATYIKSSENVRADQLSRIKNPDTEWSLSNKAFRHVVDMLGEPEIDLFASAWNAKCESFISRFPEPTSLEVDAFSINWSLLRFYAFPPFALILRILRKIVQEKAEGILVVPYWENQPWFPLFNKMIKKGPVFLGPTYELLISADRTQHPHANQLVLIAAVISGKAS